MRAASLSGPPSRPDKRVLVLPAPEAAGTRIAAPTAPSRSAPTCTCTATPAKTRTERTSTLSISTSVSGKRCPSPPQPLPDHPSQTSASTIATARSNAGLLSLHTACYLRISCTTRRLQPHCLPCSSDYSTSICLLFLLCASFISHSLVALAVTDAISDTGRFSWPRRTASCFLDWKPISIPWTMSAGVDAALDASR